MALAREKLERVAASTVPVLFQGESGTGKEILAKLLHLRSARAKYALVKVTCPAIPSTLIETELFGYEKGAFTGANFTKPGRVEFADRGTLFLDEIGSLDPSVQIKLLQLLQEGTYFRVGGQEARRIDTRLISAANESLAQQVKEGTLRLDFFFRINAVTILVPPLRQRMIDLPALVDYFLDVNAMAFRRKVKPLSRNILTLMHSYEWPGNIRQLENLVRSYVLIGSEETLAAELVPNITQQVSTEIYLGEPVCLKRITRDARYDLERQIILKVLQANGWSRQKTAKWLQISYRSLLYKLRDFGIHASPMPGAAPRVPLAKPPEPSAYRLRDTCSVEEDTP
jgi:two-component system response regulator AtoC